MASSFWTTSTKAFGHSILVSRYWRPGPFQSLGQQLDYSWIAVLERWHVAMDVNTSVAGGWLWFFPLTVPEAFSGQGTSMTLRSTTNFSSVGSSLASSRPFFASMVLALTQKSGILAWRPWMQLTPRPSLFVTGRDPDFTVTQSELQIEVRADGRGLRGSIIPKPYWQVGIFIRIACMVNILIHFLHLQRPDAQGASIFCSSLRRLLPYIYSGFWEVPELNFAEEETNLPLFSFCFELRNGSNWPNSVTHLWLFIVYKFIQI